MNIASLWVGQLCLRAFATGTYRRPLLLWGFSTPFQKRSSFGYLNFIWPSFGGKYCRQRYFAETTLDLRTTYINAWSEWNVSVLPMTLFKICFLIFHERKRGKVELSRRIHTKRIVPSEEGVPGLNKRSLCHQCQKLWWVPRSNNTENLSWAISLCRRYPSEINYSL